MENKEREILKLTSEELRDLVFENAYGYNEADNNFEFEFEEMSHKITGNSRHTQFEEKVLKRLSDGKFFLAAYETSVKDAMGWYECNCDSLYDVTEVFPKIITKTIYK